MVARDQYGACSELIGGVSLNKPCFGGPVFILPELKWENQGLVQCPVGVQQLRDGTTGGQALWVGLRSRLAFGLFEVVVQISLGRFMGVGGGEVAGEDWAWIAGVGRGEGR